MASRILEFPMAREFPKPREIPVTREFPRLKLFPPVSWETGISQEFPAHGFPLSITVINPLDSHKTSRFLHEDIICRYGVPAVIWCDQGKELRGTLLLCASTMGYPSAG